MKVIKRTSSDYVEFGKYVICYQLLKYQKRIRIYYNTNIFNVVEKHSLDDLSDELYKFMLDLLFNKNPNFDELNDIDKVYVIELLNDAHIDIGQWKHEPKEKILQILMGSIESGNNNHSQLMQFLNYQLKIKQLSKSDYNKILNEI